MDGRFLFDFLSWEGEDSPCAAMCSPARAVLVHGSLRLCAYAATPSSLLSVRHGFVAMEKPRASAGPLKIRMRRVSARPIAARAGVARKRKSAMQQPFTSADKICHIEKLASHLL